MGRTFLRQDTQIRNSDVYDDTLAAGTTLETANTNVEDDLNGVRSQQKRAFWGDLAGNWYDDLVTVNGKKRGINALNTATDSIEEKRFLFRTNLLTDITVGAGNNFYILSQASSETPTETAAVSGAAIGAVVAILAGDVGSHSLNEVSGPNALSPKNLVMVRDAVTGDPIQSGSRDVYALLQAESGVVDSDAFNDTTKQAQLSFVRINATGDDLEAVPFADIAGKTINYSYVRRVNFESLPETAMLSGVFIDAVAAAVSVTLDSAVDNQVGPVTQTTADIQWRITDTFALRFQDSAGTLDLLAVKPNVAGDEIEINVDILDINNTQNVDFANGATFDSTGTAINVGSTAGQIDSAAALTVTSGGAADLRLIGAGELLLDDGNQTGSTWAQTGGIKVSDTSAEWDAFKTAFGEVSLLNGIVQAATKENRTKSVATVTTNINPNVNVTGAGGSPNLDAQLANYSTVSFVNDVDVFVNGVMMYNGANAAANNDVYPGTSSANGDLMFEFRLKIGDVITLIAWGT